MIPIPIKISLLFSVLVFGGATYQTGCKNHRATEGPSKSLSVNCDEVGKEQIDQCLYDTIQRFDAGAWKQVYEMAQKIQDPMIQGGSVSKWIKKNNTQITREQGQKLCDLLHNKDRFYCLRRLSSPHLRR